MNTTSRATIAYPTDLEHDDQVAFAHGVALALTGGARLVSLHANAPQEALEKMPDAAALLRAWGQPEDAIEYQRELHACCDDPVDTILDGLRGLQPDLIVAATHQRSGLARFILGSRAEAIAHNVSAPTLLLPVQTQGFVAGQAGTIDLRRILIGVGDAAEAETAIRAAAWLAELAKVDDVEFHLLHVGAPVDVDVAPLSARPGWRIVRHEVPRGSVDEQIVEHAGDACVVVMATRGHDSIGDVLRGSHTDRVLHHAKCPVLSVGVR